MNNQNFFKNKTYNVFFISYIPPFSAQKNPLPFAPIPLKWCKQHEILTFLNQVNETYIPTDSCIEFIQLQEISHTNYNKSRSSIQQWQTKFNGLNIGLISNFGEKCDAQTQEQCLKNIKSGKCCDGYAKSIFKELISQDNEQRD